MLYNMKMTTADILLENAKEYYNNATEAENKGNYNTAVTLLFKAMSALCDLFILKKEGSTPSSHTDRFRILEEKYPEVYEIMDKNFPFYQDSYKSRLTKEIYFIFKNDTKKLSKIVGITL